MTTAVSDMETAYTDAAGRPSNQAIGGDIGGLTLAPGVYTTASNLLISTDVTLSGTASDVWIFQIGGTLDISSGKNIILSGGALPENVFWQVAGTTTLGTTSVFNGIILDQTLIAMQTGATLNGRALAQSAVTLDANNVLSPSGAVTSVLTSILVPPITVNVGSTLPLNAAGLDQFGLPMAATITYSSSDPSVATVDVNGLVTGVAVGSATITATSIVGGAVPTTISATSAITVDPAKSIPVMDNKLFILLTLSTLILGLYGFKKYSR